MNRKFFTTEEFEMLMETSFSPNRLGLSDWRYMGQELEEYDIEGCWDVYLWVFKYLPTEKLYGFYVSYTPEDGYSPTEDQENYLIFEVEEKSITKYVTKKEGSTAIGGEQSSDEDGSSLEESKKTSV